MCNLWLIRWDLENASEHGISIGNERETLDSCARSLIGSTDGQLLKELSDLDFGYRYLSQVGGCRGYVSSAGGIRTVSKLTILYRGR